jgi:hypothetical protein
MIRLSWVGRLVVTAAFTGVVSLACVVGLVSLCVAQVAKPADPAKKSTTVEVDLSKLPPDLAKQLTEVLKGKEVKPISLIEAITLAEKAGKAKAVQAEMDGEGAEAEFSVTLRAADGSRKTFTLDAQGKIQESKDLGKTTEPKAKGLGNGKGPPAGKGPNKQPTPEPVPKPDEAKK